VREDIEPADAGRLVLIERVLEIYPAFEGQTLTMLPVTAGHYLLMMSTYLEAEQRFAEPKYAKAWRRLAAELDAEIEFDSEEDYGPSPFKIAQRRMLDIARWCDFRERQAHAVQAGMVGP
jgi:hypothetical protein